MAVMPMTGGYHPLEPLKVLLDPAKGLKGLFYPLPKLRIFGSLAILIMLSACAAGGTRVNPEGSEKEAAIYYKGVVERCNVYEIKDGNHAHIYALICPQGVSLSGHN
jgi:hypothetical protein